MLWDDVLMVNQTVVIESSDDGNSSPGGVDLALITGNQGVFGTPALHVDPVEEPRALDVSRLGEVALSADLAFYPSTSMVSVGESVSSVSDVQLLHNIRLRRKGFVSLGSSASLWAGGTSARAMLCRLKNVSVVAPGGLVEPAEGASSLSQSIDSQPTWFPGTSSGAAGRLADLQAMSSEVVDCIDSMYPNLARTVPAARILKLVKRVYDYSSLVKNAEDAFEEAGSCVVNWMKLQRLVTNPGRLNERRVREM
eukprot:gene15510-32780_t